MRSEPRCARTPVWALSVSLAATSEITVVFFSSGYLDVSVHRVPSVYLWIQYTVTEVSSAGFPHSDICGSQLMCSSPQLFAAYHVFLRLSVPRHPPCALSCVTICPDQAMHPQSPVFCAFLFKAFVPSVTLLWLFLVFCLFQNSPPSAVSRMTSSYPGLGCLVSRLFANLI